MSQNTKQSRWWWLMKWFDTEEQGLGWQPDKPKFNYCCWRVHKCPTTERVHAHILLNFISGVRFSTLEKKGYNNIKWVKQEDLEKKRGYCQTDNHKDGSTKGAIKAFQEIGVWPERLNKRKAEDVYRSAFQVDLSVKEGLRMIQNECPRDYAIHGENIERNLRKTKPFVHKALFELVQYNMEPLDLEGIAVLVCGRTNSGKTGFARAHFKNPLFVTGSMDDLKYFDPEEHDGILFDECNTSSWKPESVIHLLDWEYPRTIRVRYSDARIPPKTKKIFTSNLNNPFFEESIPEEQKEAILRRVKIVYVTDKTY